MQFWISLGLNLGVQLHNYLQYYNSMLKSNLSSTSASTSLIYYFDERKFSKLHLANNQSYHHLLL